MNLDSKNKIYNGSHSFKRLQREAKRISPHIRFKRIKLGYYRIYFDGNGDNAYLGECYKNMGPQGYDIYEDDPRAESRQYYEEYEDQIEMSRKLQNYVDGYSEQIDKLRTNIYNMKHSKEAYETITKGYRTMRVL